MLETEGYLYAIIRLKGNNILQGHIGHLLTRPVGRPPKKLIVQYHSFRYQADSWEQDRRVVAKVVRHLRYVTFQMAEVLVSRSLFHEILAKIHQLKPVPIGYN